MGQLAALSALICIVLSQIVLSRQERRWPGLVLRFLAIHFGCRKRSR